MIESIEVAEFRFKAVGRSEVNDVTSDSRNELHVVVRLHEDLLNLVFPEGIVFDVSAKCEESGLREAFVNLSGGFRFYDAVVNDRALIERAYACGMDY